VSTVENQIVIASPDGTFGAYIARPKALPAPSVVVLHEVFGVNKNAGSRAAAASGLGRNEVRRRAKRAPLAIGRGFPGVGRLDDFECIAAEQ